MPPAEFKKLDKSLEAAGKDVKSTEIGGHSSIQQFAQSALKEIVEATKATNAFPQGAARDLYCAYPTFGKVIDQQSDRILGLISKVLKWQNIKGNIQRRQQDEQFEMLLECNDAILERLNVNLDDMAGLKKTTQPIVIESVINTTVNSPSSAGSWNLTKINTPIRARLIAAKNIARPQVKFQIPVDNSEVTPFVPKLKDKPNSLKPLAILPEYDEFGNIVSYVHPYEFELLKFEPPEQQLQRKTPITPKTLESTEWSYVDTVDKLKACLEELRKHKEIAIDVEHHSYRTFLGITCLVQLSTVDKDYLIDALVLRDDMYILNEVFTDPKVVKILHGADSDIEWLQRDLSLYLVNMFDTHQAAKILNFARLSLSFLMKHYCDIDVDKTFQMADWRIRPLPEELVRYARQDTHYLLYIYARITNDLLNANNGQTSLLRTIYQRSTELCCKRYKKPVVTDDTHLDLFRKSKRIFDNRQLSALKDLFKWRDAIARQEDESYGYVLPNHMMLQIAESLPREMQGILACCNPIPPLVRQHLHALHQIVLRAREQPLIKPILEKEPIHRVVHTQPRDYHNILYCPHDNSFTAEFRDDLSTLLNMQHNEQIENIRPYAQATYPKLGVIHKLYELEEAFESRKCAQMEKQKFIAPYLRYLAVLPLIEREKQEEAARIEAELSKRQLCPAAPLHVKSELNDSLNTANGDENDMYSMPIKEMLKRKREESDAVKQSPIKAEEGDEAQVKRFKHETPTDDKLKFVNLTPATNTATKRKSENNQQQHQIPNKKNKGKKPDKQQSAVVNISSDSDGPPNEQPTSSKALNHKQPAGPKKKNKNKRFKARKQTHQQSSNVPVQQPTQQLPSQQQQQQQQQQQNFDYKSVDFKKFKGGAQRAKGTELKSQFHGKNNNQNKSNNKKFNKLFTFSNVKSGHKK